MYTHTPTSLDVIIIGAGHAGLSVSYHLTQRGIAHVVFERGLVGETWRSQRWDSFSLNTANDINLLPGSSGANALPDAFPSAEELVHTFESYVKEFCLPVLEHARVVRLTRDESNGHFDVYVNFKGVENKYTAWQVVVASGGQNVAKIPAFAKALSPDIFQVHAKDYKHPGQLPKGNVLVAGSAQTGVQIAEDLLQAGRKVYVATSKVARIPRRYRGRDIMNWLIEVGMFDLSLDEVTDPALLEMRTPQVSGVGRYGHTVSLQSLSKGGATLFSSIKGIQGDVIRFSSNGKEHVAFGDAFSAKCKAMIEAHIEKWQLQAPLHEPDEADLPDMEGKCINPATQINLRDEGITSVVWSTGFSGDFSYLQVPVLNKDGMPIQRNGISEIPGLYFIGLVWLRKRKSGIILGISDDASFIADQVHQYSPVL